MSQKMTEEDWDDVNDGFIALKRNLINLSNDRWAVLALIDSFQIQAARVIGGYERYGAVNLPEDERDFEKEAEQELGDALFYTKLAQMKKGIA